MLATYPPIIASEVDVWFIDQVLLAGSIERLKPLLSDQEAARAAKFKFETHRNQYILIHAVLRRNLANYLACEPNELMFIEGPHGKPDLVEPADPRKLRFNISHSHNAALLAVTGNKEIGVDIEYIKPDFDWQGIVENFFAPGEIAKLKSLPPDSQRRAFYACWTRKESYIKAKGGGLSIPLDGFEVSVDPAEPAALLSCTNDPKEVERWSMANLDVGAGYAAALTVEGPLSSIQFQRWNFASEPAG